MIGRNKDEELIYRELRKIQVDTSKIKDQVRLGLEASPTPRPKGFLRSGILVALSLFLVVGVSASLLRNSQWFMEKFNPAFKDIVRPIDMYSQDQGIKIKLLSGQKYDNNALVYLGIQDTSGQNRITEKTDFRDGFFINMDNLGSPSSYDLKSKLINFDKETNTIYYEFNITGDTSSPLGDSLRLGTSRIYFDSIDYKDKIISLEAEDLASSKYFYLEEDKIFGGRKLTDQGDHLLEMGNYASMPHGDKSQWISNVGLRDKRLHIQVASDFTRDFGPNDPFFTIKDGENEPRPYQASRVFLTDKAGRVLDINKDGYDLAAYKYEEFIFPPLEPRDLYEVAYSGTIHRGLVGQWELQADLNRDSENIKYLDKSFDLEDYHFDKISLNPLGLSLSGTYSGDRIEEEFRIELLGQDGPIKLKSAGGSLDGDMGFILDYKASRPINVKKIKGLLINGLKVDF